MSHMTNKKVSKETGRYGARYGMTVRRRTLKILQARGKKVQCPNCGKVSRMIKLSVGVWQCPKCEYTYAGQAYTAEL